MRTPTLIRCFVVLAALACGPSFAIAAPTERGLLLGFGAGGGSAGVTGGEHRRGGTALGLSVGYVLHPEYALALGTTGWTRTLEGQTVSFTVTGAEFDWYPRGGDFSVRAMAGLGRGMLSTQSGYTLRYAGESGLGFSAGLGYELRLARTLTLGPQTDFNWVVLDDATLRWWNGYVTLRWYPVLQK